MKKTLQVCLVVMSSSTLSLTSEASSQENTGFSGDVVQFATAWTSKALPLSSEALQAFPDPNEKEVFLGMTQNFAKALQGNQNISCLDFTGVDFTANDMKKGVLPFLLELLKNTGSIQELIFTRAILGSKDWKAISHQLPASVSKISFAHTSFSDVELQSMGHILLKLKSVDLSGTPLSPFAVPFLKILIRNGELKKLNLSGLKFGNLGNTDRKDFLEAVNASPKLRELKLKDTCLSPDLPEGQEIPKALEVRCFERDLEHSTFNEEMETLLKNVYQGNGEQNLSIIREVPNYFTCRDPDKTTDKSTFRALKTALKNAPNLETLILKHFIFSDEQLQELLDLFVAPDHPLKIFGLKYSQKMTQSSLEILKNAPVVSRLTTLKLTEFGDLGSALSMVLLPNFKELFLEDNQLKDGDLETFLPALDAMIKERSEVPLKLYLDENPLTMKGIEYFQKFIASHPLPFVEFHFANTPFAEAISLHQEISQMSGEVVNGVRQPVVVF